MAKSQKQTEQNNEVNAIEVLKHNDALTFANANASALEVITDFSSIDKTQLVGLTQEYLNLEEEKTYDLIFKGMSEFKGDNDKTVPAVLLVGQDGMNYINGNTVLVNSLKKVTKLPCLCRIVTGRKQKSAKGGFYLQMEVYTFGENLQTS